VVFKALEFVKFVLERMNRTMNDTQISLTEREQQVLRLVAAGQTTPQIAGTLCLGVETIRWYRKKLLAKFGASTSAEMVRMAIEMGLLK
jgi:DNA-binding NarL/FixJ family response regulator